MVSPQRNYYEHHSKLHSRPSDHCHYLQWTEKERNPSEWFHLSPQGFCTDKRWWKGAPLSWKGCLKALVTLLNSQPLWHSPWMNRKLWYVLPVSASTTNIILIILTISGFFSPDIYEHMVFSCPEWIPLPRCAITVLPTGEMLEMCICNVHISARTSELS